MVGDGMRWDDDSYCKAPPTLRHASSRLNVRQLMRHTHICALVLSSSNPMRVKCAALLVLQTHTTAVLKAMAHGVRYRQQDSDGLRCATRRGSFFVPALAMHARARATAI